MDPLLEVLKDAQGRPRFYPPGQHPGTARLRAYLVKLEELHKDIVDAGATSTDAEEAINYVKDQIAIFEQGESEDKALTFYIIKHRKGLTNE